MIVRKDPFLQGAIDFHIHSGPDTHPRYASCLDLARQAREQNHPRLALLYYKIAFLLSDYSPNVTEFVSLKVAQEMSQVKTDYLPSGVPQLWTLPDNSNYTVFNADIYIENDEPWINIDWLVDSFADTNKLDQDSEKLLGFSLDKFAEANEFFVGVIVTAHSQDPKLINQVFRKFRRFPQKPQ